LIEKTLIQTRQEELQSKEYESPHRTLKTHQHQVQAL
jgi:hypothetical protein